jgi:flagellar biosynthesis protein
MSARMNDRYPVLVAESQESATDAAKPALAIALHYNGRGAPRVTAKGGGEVAQRIMEKARQHGVPLEEDAALAGALSRVDLGREIPRELWIAVAQVLTFAWSVAGKKKP